MFSSMIGKRMASGKMLNLLVWHVGFLFCFGFVFFFCLWTAMSTNHLHGCLMEPVLLRETNSVKLAYFVNLGMNQKK